MAFFKVCDSKRACRKMVFGVTTIEQLKTEGQKKLGLDKVKQVVLEEDGCILETTDPLEFFPKGEVFMLLVAGEKWTPAACASTNQPATPGPSCPVSPTSQQDTSDSEHKSGAVAEPDPGPSADKPSDDDKADEDDDSHDTTVEKEVLKKLKTMPLPELHGLPEKDPQLQWKGVLSRAVQQTAWYFWPTLKDVNTTQTHYLIIGKRMIAKFPHLQFPGRKPWSQFNIAFAIRIRKMRQDMKKKSEGVGPSKSPVPVFCGNTLATNSDRDMVDEEEGVGDVELHIEALQKEWKKEKKSTAHIRQLMKFTRKHRAELLKAHPGGQLTPIFEEYPCLQSAENIVYDIELVRAWGPEKVKEMKTKAKQLETFLLQESKAEDSVQALLYLDKSVGATKGKFRSENLISVFKDVPSSEFRSKLETLPFSSPKVVCFTHSGGVAGCFIVGDDETIACNTADLADVLVQILAVYYAFDLVYPDGYCMFLAFLQTSIWGEHYQGTTTQGYKYMLKSWLEYENKLPAEEPIS